MQALLLTLGASKPAWLSALTGHTVTAGHWWFCGQRLIITFSGITFSSFDFTYYKQKSMKNPFCFTESIKYVTV